MEPFTKLFIGNKDVDRQILLRAGDEQLFAACQADTYSASLCNNYFWGLRFERKFGVNLDHYGKEKPLNYRKLYIEFSKISNNPYKFLLHAIEHGFIELVQWAIARGADYEYDDYAAIKKAASYDRLNILELLLEHVSDDDYQEVINESLIFAAGSNNINIVDYLLQQDADIHHENENALQTAAYEGYLDMVKYLVLKGSYLHKIHENLLEIAAESNNVDILKYLLDQGLDIHTNNETALTWAARFGSLEAFKYLIAQGADVTAGNYRAISWTIINGHVNILDYIINELHIIPSFYSVLLASRSAITNNKIEMIEYLLKNKLINDADVYTLTTQALSDKPEIAKLLLSYLNEKDKKLLVDEIVKLHNINLLRFLVNNGVNIVNDQSLQLAADFGKYKIIRYLLDQGNDVNILDDYLNDKEIRKIYKEYGVSPIEIFRKSLKKENILFLRNMLDKRGLPSGGTRPELIERIVNNPTKAEIKEYGLEEKEKEKSSIEKPIKKSVKKKCTQCIAITKKGTQCQNCARGAEGAKPGLKYCGIHAKK